MSETTEVERFLSTAEGRAQYAAAELQSQAARLLDLMHHCGARTSSEVAALLDVTEERVAEVVSSDRLITIAGLAKYASAFGYLVKIVAEPVEPDAEPLPEPGRRRKP